MRNILRLESAEYRADENQRNPLVGVGLRFLDSTLITPDDFILRSTIYTPQLSITCFSKFTSLLNQRFHLRRLSPVEKFDNPFLSNNFFAIFNRFNSFLPWDQIQYLLFLNVQNFKTNKFVKIFFPKSARFWGRLTKCKLLHQNKCNQKCV